jgi:hypothetical protein
MSAELEAAVQDLFKQGEASGMKYSPATASMYMLSNAEIARDWTARLAISEDGVRKLFMKMSAMKKKKAKDDAKREINGLSDPKVCESSTSSSS